MSKTLEQYKTSYQYQDLLKNHTLSEYGIWEILGEDPNCYFGGHHHQPFLGHYEGTLEDVIAFAVELTGFWKWGAGGSIKKVVSKPVVKIDEFNKHKKEIEIIESQIKTLTQKLDELKIKVGMK